MPKRKTTGSRSNSASRNKHKKKSNEKDPDFEVVEDTGSTPLPKMPVLASADYDSSDTEYEDINPPLPGGPQHPSALKTLTRGHRLERKSLVPKEVCKLDASKCRKSLLEKAFNVEYVENKPSVQTESRCVRTGNKDEMLQYIISSLQVTSCSNPTDLREQITKNTTAESEWIKEAEALFKGGVATSLSPFLGDPHQLAKAYDNFKLYAKEKDFSGAGAKLVYELIQVLRCLLPDKHCDRKGNPDSIHAYLTAYFYLLHCTFSVAAYSGSKEAEENSQCGTCNVSASMKGACEFFIPFNDPDVLAKEYLMAVKPDGLLAANKESSGEMPILAVEVKTNRQLVKVYEELEKEFGNLSSTSSMGPSPRKSVELKGALTAATPAQRPAFDTMAMAVAKNEERKAQKLYSLKTQHFLELLASLQACNKKGYRNAVYGLFVVKNHVLPTCLRVVTAGKPVPLVSDVAGQSCQNFSNFKDHFRLWMEAKSYVVSAGKVLDDQPNRYDFQLQMISCFDYLDLFNPEHWSAIMWWIQYLVHCETQHNSL